MIEDASLPIEELMARLAANAPEAQGLLAAAHGAGMIPDRLAVSELSIRLELHLAQSRAVEGSVGIGLSALPLGAYVRGAYAGGSESGCVLELEIRQVPARPAQP